MSHTNSLTSNLPYVSIVIPAYNCASTIKKTIKALDAQDYPLSIQVIVVDDGSIDETRQVLTQFKHIEYIYQPNSGPAQARNKGGHLARNELIAFVDADCIPHSDWISKLISAFSSENIGAVSGSYGIANPDSRLAACIHQEIIYRHARFSSQDIHVFGSYNVCIPREVFIRAGGYDSRFRHASGEDNDLSYRIINMGYKIRFQPKAIVDHHHPHRVPQYLQEQYIHGYWRARIYRIYPAMMRGDDYTFWKDIIEPIAVLFIAFTLMLTPIFGLSAFISGVLVLLALIFCELVFAMKILTEMKNSLWFAGVMFLRSFYRTLGFLHGLLALWRPFIRENPLSDFSE